MSMKLSVDRTVAPLAVTYREAARRLGVSERTVWGIVHAGKLRSFRVGKCVRIPVVSLMQFMDEQSTQA